MMSDAINKPAHYNQGSIECIEAMKIVLTPEEFRGYLKGNVFKYLWREKDKNGNEDIRKGKSYYDWLIELIDEHEQQKAADLQSLKDHPFGKLKEPAIKQPSTPEPPDGWRWLEVGEVIRKGDEGFENGRFYAIEPTKIGMTLQAHWRPAIRRNGFEVGEKVVRVSEPRGIVFRVKCAFLDNSYGLATEGGLLDRLSGNHLAPYIEEAK